MSLRTLLRDILIGRRRVDPEAASLAADSVNLESPLPAEVQRPIWSVQEVADARFFVNDLFRLHFRSDAPDYPRHFVIFYTGDQPALLRLGYVHYSRFEDSWLCGGMVMDHRTYRRVPAAHREMIRAQGGVAEIMLRATFAVLADAPAIWGHVGEKLAEAVDLRAGFVHTTDSHLMVVWNRELPDEEKAARLARVLALGPF